MTDEDRTILRARRELASRMSVANCPHDATEMLTQAIIETGGVFALPPREDYVAASKHLVEISVHGLTVTATTLEEAVAEWLDCANGAQVGDPETEE